MNTPKITIITACFNSEATIEKTIQSVLNQSYKDIEYIIVDGASTDKTIPIIDQYKNRMHTVISEPDKGVYDAFNKGLSRASGDFIYFLNSDDYLIDEKVIESVADVIVNNPENDIYYGNILFHNPYNGYRVVVGRSFSLDDFKKGIMPPHPGLFANRKLFEKLGGFDLNYGIASDFDLTLRMFKRDENAAFYMNRLIAVFTTGGLSTQLQNQDKIQSETAAIVGKYLSESYPLSLQSEQNRNLSYYKKWIESLLIGKSPITSSLFLQGIKKAAIFGTVEMSLSVLADLKQAGIEVVAFLDNDIRRHGIVMNGIQVFAPTWLESHASAIDAIVMAFEGNYEEEITKQIHQITVTPPLITSWKDLIKKL